MNAVLRVQRTWYLHGPSSYFFFIWRNSHQWARASSFTRFLDHTQRRTTVGRIALREGLARLRDLYLATHNTHNRHPCPRWGSNPQSQQAPQTYALDRAVTGTDVQTFTSWNYGNRIMLFSALQTPVLCLSSSDGLHLDVVKIKETDRDGLLVTFVGRCLACNWTLCMQTTHWQCTALCNKCGLKKIRCCIGTVQVVVWSHATLVQWQMESFQRAN